MNNNFKDIIGVFLQNVKIDPERKCNQMSRDDRDKIVGFLKNFSLDVVGASSVENAMVTRGGVSLKEINPRTMESKKFKNLFFAGEMINIDGDTGGFNLQAAFSTGYLSGQSASK